MWLCSIFSIGFFANTLGASQFSDSFECPLQNGRGSCNGRLEVAALIKAQLSRVDRPVSLDLLALNQFEGLAQNSGLKKLSNARTTIDQGDAIIQSFTYDNLDNLMRPIFVQFINVLKGKELLVIEVSCASRDCADYQPALAELRDNLKVRPDIFGNLLK
jgi:hypothetical protein